MKRIILTFFLCPALLSAVGPKYTYPSPPAPPGMDDEVNNIYHSISVIPNAQNLITTAISGIANAKDYGAKGDGITDDTNAIQGAVNSSSTTFIPCGTYIVGGVTVSNRNGFSLLGAGWCTTLKRSSSYAGTVVNISSATDLQVSNFVIDGASTTDVNNSYNGITLDGCVRCTIQHLKILNVEGDGIHMVNATQTSHDNTISDNFVYALSGNGINCFNGAQNEDNIFNNRFYVSNSGNGQGGQMELTNSKIIGNVFDAGPSIGLTLAGDGNTLRSDNVVTGNRFYGVTYGLEFGNYQDGTLVSGNHIEGGNANNTAALKASTTGSGHSGQIAAVGNSIYGGCQMAYFPSAGSSAWLLNSNYLMKSSTTESSSWIRSGHSSATIEGNIMDGLNMTSNHTFIDQVIEYDDIIGNQFFGNSGDTAINAKGTDHNIIALNRVSEPMTDVLSNTNGFQNLIINSTYTFSGVSGISSDDQVQVKPKNLRGSVTISGAATTGTVTFTTTETNSSYFVSAIVSATAGPPAAGSTRIYITGKGTTGFTVNTEVAPGAGNSVTVDWHMVR